MSLNTQAPERATKTVYGAVVFDDNAVVLDDTYEHPAARRDAVIELLRSNHDEVDHADIDAILLPLGGANADVALEQVVELFTIAHADIEVHLVEREQDAGPGRLYTAFTDHGDGNTVVEHYATREARLTQLRLRAEHVATDYPSGFFDDADEETCRKALEYHVTANGGRVYLLDAVRQSDAEVFIGYGEAA